MVQLPSIETAKAPVLAYGEKNWNAVKGSVTPGIVYDEIATHRKTNGVEQLLKCWQGWATAFPDSKAAFQNAFATGDTVVLEVKWRGTHKGELQTPEGRFEATGKSIEVPACMIVEIGDGKVKAIRHYFDMATLFQQLGLAKAA
jgi:steroid delta-isomerase-like uncharacterized protein